MIDRSNGGQAVLALNAVTFRRNGIQILDGVDFTVRTGERWALLGENGAGKSTILSLCGGLAHPSSGTVDILGHRVGRVDLREIRRLIGHVNPRHPLRGAPSVTEVVLTGITGTIELPMRWEPTDTDLKKAHSLITDIGLDSHREAPWPTLSQGERGRALIARALAGDPQLLLLDEPTTGLDLAARERLLETLDGLAESNVTSLLVTHHLEELPATTTHAALIRQGALTAAGPVEQVVTSENISKAFDYPIRVTRDEGRWGARRSR